MSIFEWVAKGKTADLLRAHPLEIVALAENSWREGAREVGASPDFAWPENIIQQVLITDFSQRLITPVELKRAELWPHLIYAYLIENTGIFEIFRKVSELYRLDSRLPPLKKPAHFPRWQRIASRLRARTRQPYWINKTKFIYGTYFLSAFSAGLAKIKILQSFTCAIGIEELPGSGSNHITAPTIYSPLGARLIGLSVTCHYLTFDWSAC